MPRALLLAAGLWSACGSERGAPATVATFMLTPTAAAVASAFESEFSEAVGVPAFAPRRPDCSSPVTELIATLYLPTGSRAAQLTRLYLSADGRRIVSSHRATVLRPAGRFRTLVVMPRYAETTGGPAMARLARAQLQINLDHEQLARARGYAEPLVAFENVNVEADASAVRNVRSRSQLRSLVRDDLGVDTYDIVVAIDLDPANDAGGAADVDGRFVYMGNFGRWRRPLDDAEWLKVARAVYHHEVGHLWGWQHDWAPTCGGARPGHHPFVAAPRLFGWDDLDGDGRAEIADDTPYGRSMSAPRQTAWDRLLQRFS